MRKSIFLGLSLLGLFAALYLLWTYISPSRPMVCIGGGCDAVRASAYAYPWGVPMPVFGVAGYVLIILLMIAQPLVDSGAARLARYALAAGTTFGFLFSAYLDYLQGFVIHAYCTWCVTSGVILTALCGLALYDALRPGPEGDAPAQLAQVRTYFLVGVAALLLGVPAFYELARHGEVPPAPKAPTDSLAARLIRPDNHVTGNLHAALSLVEFGDFQCPVCGPEEKVLQKIRKRYAHQVRFVFRQFPLIRIHPFAWRAAQASECAAEQGKFWEAVDKIYSRQSDLSEEGLHRDAAEIGLDQAKFGQCMQREPAAQRVRQDLEDGKALGVTATPTFFIGHQALAGAPNVEEFSRIIDQELAAPGIELSTASMSRPAASVPPAASAPAQAKNPAKHTTVSRPTAPAKSAGETTSAAFPVFGSTPGAGLSGFSAGAATCSEAEAAEQQPTLINTPQLRQLLAGGTNPLFVDVRPPEEYAKTRIPEAVNIPAGKMPQRWDTLPKDRVIVFYESGQTSGDVCAFGRAAGRILLKHGYPFSQVKVYQDGLAGWQKSGLGTAR
jgi:protein-disulfide isomerase/rhodanese-related sulfurtransferase/uncharacterized membrane protein